MLTKLKFTVALTDTAEQLWQGMAEVIGFLVLILSKLPDEKKLAIKNDVIESLSEIFSSSGPLKLTVELILGTAIKPVNFNQICVEEVWNHKVELSGVSSTIKHWLHLFFVFINLETFAEFADSLS